MPWEAPKAPTNSNPTGPAFLSSFRVPNVSNPTLAYETGLHIGDGNLSNYPPHYRYVLSGNRINEFDFYTEVVSPMLENLYGLKPTVSVEGNSVYATVYSKKLVYFKALNLGLPIGKKDYLQGLPPQILSQGRVNRGELVSGIMDADGSPKVRRTSSGDYPRISFAQKVKGIVNDVKEILSTDFEISSTLYRNDYFDKRTSVVETRWFLDINGFENLRKYTKFIGSKSPYFKKGLQRLAKL